MRDVLGVNDKVYGASSIRDWADEPEVRKAIADKFHQMRKHLTFVQMSITTLEHAVRSPGTLKTLHAAQLKKQLRDWVLSVVMEEGWIEAVLGSGDDWRHFRDLAKLAAGHAGQSAEPNQSESQTPKQLTPVQSESYIPENLTPEQKAMLMRRDQLSRAMHSR
jgi:hypothetical protein